jgi:hypothetical protein
MLQFLSAGSAEQCGMPRHSSRRSGQSCCAAIYLRVPPHGATADAKHSSSAPPPGVCRHAHFCSDPEASAPRDGGPK